MEIFKATDKMVSVIRSNYHLLPVLDRFGVKLGFRDASIDEVCRENSINRDFFLAIINTFNNASYFPREELLRFSPVAIIQYLRQTHKYYLGQVLPKMDELLKRLIEGAGQDSQDLKVIKVFYNNYKEELVSHIQEEEELVFPYIIDLINGKERKGMHPGIHAFEKEHSNVEIKLNDLKNLILKYVNPNYDPNVCYEFISILFQFERDITDHARIEDKILVPMVRKIENKKS